MRKDRPFTASLSDLTFQDLIGIAKRQKWWILGALLLFIGLASLFSILQKPGYQSFAQLRLEGDTQSSVRRNDGTGLSVITDPVNNMDVLTQIQMLQSSNVFFKALQAVNIPIPQTAKDIENLPEVRVNQIGTTQIIQLAVIAEDPDTARALTTALVNSYKTQREADQRERITRSLAFVAARLRDENEAMTKLQNDLASYRQQNRIVDIQTETSSRLQQKQIADNQLAEAQNEAVAAEQAYNSMVATYNATPQVRTIVTNQPNREQLESEKTKLAELKNIRERSLAVYLPEAPQIRQLDAQIAEQQRRIDSLEQAFETTVTTYNTQRDVYAQDVMRAQANMTGARARVQRAQANVAQRAQELNALAPLIASLTSLGRQMEDRQQSIVRLTATRDELQLRNNELKTLVDEITPAQPSRKIRPNWGINLALGSVLGLLAGLLLAITLDIAKDKVNTAEQATFVTEKDILARIPMRSRNAHPLISDPTRARAFEAYRLLRSSALLATADEHVGSFLVTSSKSGEGKSVVASNFAVALALEGKRVILVDSNLRTPILHKIFGLKDEKGLTHAIEDPTLLDEILQDTQFDSLKVITAGERVANPTELLGGPQMAKLAEVLKSKADFLVFDSPAAFNYADAQSLVGSVPTVLFVTDLGTPNKSELRESVAMLDYAHANVLGLVINKDRSAASRLA
ncbi:MAG: polysaccharide biosynthesis tyrosine autokinase [Fimbriimonadaceae bacterium]|nr:polysaccharide biosynthesis tyrosine autokinase [Fimbriimonadaceae bacterium]